LVAHINIHSYTAGRWSAWGMWEEEEEEEEVVKSEMALK
jgi:hypothetical protein